MNHICLILFLLVVSLWYFFRECPTLFGMFQSTCALRRVHFIAVPAIAMAAVVLLFCLNAADYVPSTVYDVPEIDCQSLMIVLLSSMITLVVLTFLSVSGSAVYSFAGAMAAFCLLSDQKAESLNLYVLAIFLAPLAAFLISYLLRRLFGLFERRTRIHLLMLSDIMRILVVLCLALASLAAAFNWGSLIVSYAWAIDSSSLSTFIVPAVIISVMIAASVFRRYQEELTIIYSDLSVYTVLSVGLSSVLILFLCPYALSLSSLVFASLAGAELSQRTHMMEGDSYVKELSALIIVPLGSFVTAYLLLYMTGMTEGDVLLDFTVLSAAILVLAGLLFAVYVRKQTRQKQAVDRLVYSQQQQIYEHSRALNDMELKVVLSENQALHNAVEMKRQEVMNVALSIVEQKEYLESLNKIVSRLSSATEEKEKEELIDELSISLKQRLSYDRDVDSQYFYAQAEYLHEDFYAKLSENFPGLTPQEKRLATLLRLGFSSKYIATLMNITVKSVEISRYRLRQKLGLSKGDNLVNFIKSI